MNPDLNLTKTISLPEALWLALAIIGLVVHVINGMAATGDVRRLVRSGTNTVRLLIATDSQRTEWMLFLIQVAHAIAATLAMFRPPPLRTLRFPLNVFLYLFLFSQVLLVWSSHTRRVTRQQVIKILEERSK